MHDSIFILASGACGANNDDLETLQRKPMLLLNQKKKRHNNSTSRNNSSCKKTMKSRTPDHPLQRS